MRKRNSNKILSVVGLCAVLLHGCGTPVAPISPEGTLTVLSLQHSLPLSRFDENWIFRGVSFSDLVSGAVPSLALIQDSSGKAINLRNDKEDYLLIRKTSATLVASPFLSWEWKTSGNAPHFRIVIGFNGGKQKQTFIGIPNLGTNFPDFDRSMTIAQKLTLDRQRVLEFKPKRAFVDVGVAPYLKGTWKRETIDLQDLYSSIWPADRLSNIEVVFIGISVAKSQKPSEAKLRSIVLSK